MNKANHDNDQFKFVYKSGQTLDRVGNNNIGLLSKLRKKWTGAAVIALASSSVLLFSTQNVKAAQQDGQDKGSNDPVVQENNQNNNQILQAVERKADKDVGQPELDTQKQVKEVNNSTNNQDLKESQSNTNASEVKADNQTADQAGQKDANGVELPANNQDHIKANVQSAWDQGYKGEHTVVVVIDSGVDVYHKDFLNMPKDPKLTADQVKELIKKLGHGRYVDEKFPYVYNAVDNQNGHMEAPDDEPHGQHVSGIIAANGHPDGDKEYVVGVAPEAQLLHFKVFGDNATSLDIAQEIYDAVNLGADVINMSLGGGVSIADLNNQEQRAVQYAVDHGVVVAISASNNGNAASVDNPDQITDLDNYSPGGNAGNYQPFSSSTIANPGAARGAITVAAETSGLGENSDMADFSSWGPLPDYTLKPDVSAPGSKVISTANNNTYTTMSGTSMASPFVAGAAALVKQRLQKTNPELKGAALVEAVKALLTNTAQPQVQNGYTTLVSPRRQGAGQINVGAATASQAYVTTSDGTGVLSLRKVGESTDFVLTFHNLSDHELSYNFDDFGGGFTEFRDKDTGIFHDVQLAGARVNGDAAITLKPNETKQVTYTLNLTNLKQNQLVEGFLKFTNSKDQSTLVVPYLSFYGDMTNEDVFDQNANDPKVDIQGNRFVNEDNYPRGIADEDSLKELINIDGDYNWQEVAKLYESGKVAFSPNGDNKSDLIKPYAYLKQNIQDLKVEVLDGNGKVIRVLTDSHGVEKSYHSDGDNATVDLGYGATNTDSFGWDGKLYDSKTGKMIAAPDGNYTYRFVATLYNDGEKKVQTNDTPVIIDTTAPVLTDVEYNGSNHTLTGKYSDKGAGFTDYSYATVTINDQVFGFKLNDKNSAFDNAAKTKGHFDLELTEEQLKALSGSNNLVTLALSDVADNTVVKTIEVAGSTNKPGVSIWNATNGLPFNKKSQDYHTENDTFDLKGSATADFFVNGKLVQVDANGQFVLPVDTEGEQTLVFSTDDAGKNVVKTFKNFTPKAKFAWQHVDGEEKHFGPAIYSIFGNNPDDIVVQAAVTKGDNVKAFAKDYFTGEIYTGEVKDGVATFHVKTSINKDDKSGIFARALLQGWTEIDGPTFNDRQVTDSKAIKDENYIGVYFDKDAKSKVYSSRDQLGVEMTDEAADSKDFGPGYYPPYSAPTDASPNIKFDYLSDNNTATVGAEAVENGYYNLETHEFTLTGNVDDKVISLTFLADSPYEDAPENQADISNNGHFKVTFKINPTATRSVAYKYMTNDGKVTRGALTLILDTVLPTLHLDQVPDSNNSIEITTADPNFKISGTANDNLDSYAVTVNGDNIFTQFGNAGYNFIPGLYDDPNQRTPNTYGKYDFNLNEQLDDENGQKTTHVFTVQVVDAVGNKVEKRLIVHFDPHYVDPSTKASDDSNKEVNLSENNPEDQKESTKTDNQEQNSKDENKSATNPDSNDQKQESKENQGLSDFKPNKSANEVNTSKANNDKDQSILPTFPVESTENSGLANNSGSVTTSTDRKNNINSTEVNENTHIKTIILTHNAFVYNQFGTKIKKHGKAIVYKKGKQLQVLGNRKVVVIKGKKFYQIGKNKFVRVSNTLEWKKVLRNAKVYNEKLKVVGQIKKGKQVLLTGKFISKKGQIYYQLSNGKFIRSYDLKIK